ncbi:hypothetical protein NDU88_007385 [Pleurodeles waltl]|uniref:Uncharacterized protein n=1 Tax=Pleurodeles waltl TaxID=8319 RepID=A0AAV7WHD2_PLEWA|nr:hypothetical protein NDU88_007385 [Pleurodeles waltl]
MQNGHGAHLSRAREVPCTERFYPPEPGTYRALSASTLPEPGKYRALTGSTLQSPEVPCTERFYPPEPGKYRALTGSTLQSPEVPCRDWFCSPEPGSTLQSPGRTVHRLVLPSRAREVPCTERFYPPEPGKYRAETGSALQSPVLPSRARDVPCTDTDWFYPPELRWFLRFWSLVQGSDEVPDALIQSPSSLVPTPWSQDKYFGLWSWQVLGTPHRPTCLSSTSRDPRRSGRNRHHVRPEPHEPSDRGAVLRAGDGDPEGPAPEERLH